MNKIPEMELVQRALEWVHENSLEGGVGENEITGQTDLLSSGVLDSLGFLNLVEFLESSTGTKIDLLDIEPTEFTTLDGLCRLVTNHNRE